ncbi:transposase [Paraburkholderia sp. RL17-347-BIC-D]|uniref:transposase n=1 Tax=Paraburkholderia sp. RL17-347-BIC-D TaxID=3031632 RepID=UPI0038B6D233
MNLLLRLHRRYDQLSNEIVERETELRRQLAENETGQRLLTISGIGEMSASSLLAMAGDAHGFKYGRDFAASLGLVPRQHSTGGRVTLLGISKRGDRRNNALGVWVQALLRRRHTNIVACALANKMARMVWAILAKGGEYRADPRPA